MKYVTCVRGGKMTQRLCNQLPLSKVGTGSTALSAPREQPFQRGPRFTLQHVARLLLCGLLPFHCVFDVKYPGWRGDFANIANIAPVHHGEVPICKGP